MRAIARRVLLVSLAAGLLVLASCRRSGEAPADSGAPRIVALSPGVAETLDALGLASALVGRHAFDDFSPSSIPAVGDQAGIDYEALLRVRPTHVLLEKSAAGAPPRLLELARARSFTVHEVPMLTLGEIRAALRDLPAIVGADHATARGEQLARDLDDALAPVPGFRERVGRVLPLYWTDPAGVAGPGSYHAEIILTLGGELAVNTGAAYQQLDGEDVRRLDPDSIVLFMPGADPARVRDLLGPLAALDLRAVREGRVAVLNHPRAQTPGPAAIDLARALAEAARAWPTLDASPARD